MDKCTHKAGYYFNFDGISGCVACMQARIAELESLIKGIHDNVYDGEIYGWDEGSDEWQQMRDIARKALLGGGE